MLQTKTSTIFLAGAITKNHQFPLHLKKVTRESSRFCQIVHLVLWMVAQNWAAAQPDEKSTERDTAVEGLFFLWQIKA